MRIRREEAMTRPPLVACKGDERAWFCGTVTDWGLQMYAEAVP